MNQYRSILVSSHTSDLIYHDCFTDFLSTMAPLEIQVSQADYSIIYKDVERYIEILRYNYTLHNV